MYSEATRMITLAADRAEARRRKEDEHKPPSKLRQWLEHAVLDPEVEKRMTGVPEEFDVVGPDDEEKAHIVSYAGGVQLVYLFRRPDGARNGGRRFILAGIQKRFRRPSMARQELTDEFVSRFASASLKRMQESLAI